MICPNRCYKINRNDAKYCEKCGYKFTDEDRHGYRGSASKSKEAEG